MNKRLLTDLFSSSFWIILADFQIEDLSPSKGRDSPTANGRQVPCRDRTDSSANSAVNDRDCARAAVHTWGAIYTVDITPQRYELKIGSKEPKNRLKLIPLTVSKRLWVFLLFAYFLCQNHLQAQSPSHPSKEVLSGCNDKIFSKRSEAQTKKYQLSVCAIFKNESPYLKEWIEYHKLIGVDHFYLYNLGSVDGFKKVLSPYIKSKLVTLVQWNDLVKPSMLNELLWVLSTQIPAYENAAKWRAIEETQWLVFLDIDEFLVPCSNEKMDVFLNQYEDAAAIILSVEHYDASLRTTLPPRKLVIETTEMTATPPCKLRKAVEKTIFKPKLCKSITWPPYHYEYKEGKKGIKIEKNVMRINRYENRMQFQRLDKVKRKFYQDSKTLTESEKSELMNGGYEIEDSEKIIFKFLPELYQQMGIAAGKTYP